MNGAILDEAVQKYINEHLKNDVHKIAMSKIPFPNVSAQELAGQIAAKVRAEKKLPTWFNTPSIYYPQLLSIEQCSSEKTASYKSTLIDGNQVLDLTGGFGVDSLFFSKSAAKVTHCELLPELSRIAAHNAKAINAVNIKFLNTDGIEFLLNTEERFTTIYIDPARRGKSGKVFMLKDCSPNVVEHLDLLLSKSKRVIIKTSPLLDISAGLKELKNVSEVQIISVKNECKELLFILDAVPSSEPLKITSVTINEQTKKVTFQKTEPTFTSEDQTTHDPENTAVKIPPAGDDCLISPAKINPQDTHFADTSILQNNGLLEYLYEPDVALLKSGAFNEIATIYDLEKLEAQSQLYTANQFNKDFPGRIFQIQEVLGKKDLKKHKDLRGNVIVRNYPAKAEELVKAFKIKSSREEFLIFTKVKKIGYVILKASILQHY